MLCAQEGSARVAELLLAAGAQIELQGQVCVCVFACACSGLRYSHHRTPPLTTCFTGRQHGFDRGSARGQRRHGAAAARCRGRYRSEKYGMCDHMNASCCVAPVSFAGGD